MTPSLLDEMIAQLEASTPEAVPLTEADLERLGYLVTSCDACGDGCCDPDCYRCYSPLRPENLRTLATNFATAATLCRAWQLRDAYPTWRPGCGEPAAAPSTTPIQVVSGLAVRDGQILMGLRKRTGLRPDLWELPGGKLDPHELPNHALAREWQEELGVTVRPDQIGPLLATATLDTENVFVVELYPVTIDDSFQPRALDHVVLRWIEPDRAVRELPCSPAFYLHYQAVVRWIDRLHGSKKR